MISPESRRCAFGPISAGTKPDPNDQPDLRRVPAAVNVEILGVSTAAAVLQAFAKFSRSPQHKAFY